MWAMRVHQEDRNDLQLAAVGPTSDSALPIRAKLSEDPNIVGRKGGMTCSSAAVEPTSDSALPIRAKLFGGPEDSALGLRSPQKSEIFGGPEGIALPIRADLDGAPRSRQEARNDRLIIQKR